MWKWFARTGEGYEPVEFDAADDLPTEVDSADALPPHVQEFLAMKAAAGF